MNLGEVCPWPLLFVLSLGRDVLPILRSTWTPSMISLLTAFLVMMLTTTWQWNSLQGSLWWRTGQALPLGLLPLVTLLFRSISPKPQDFEQELHGLQVLTWKFINHFLLSFVQFKCTHLTVDWTLKPVTSFGLLKNWASISAMLGISCDSPGSLTLPKAARLGARAPLGPGAHLSNV